MEIYKDFLEQIAPPFGEHYTRLESFIEYRERVHPLLVVQVESHHHGGFNLQFLCGEIKTS